MFCYIASIDNTGVVKRFHYYLSRQLIGDGTEIRMKKELEFNNNKYIITECWNYYRVELALQDEGNIPWYIENFIQYEIYDDFVSFYYEPNSQDWASPNYDEVISYKECKYGEDVKEIIENAIDLDGYPMLYVDMEYLRSEGWYHELLIIGYDTEEEKYKCVVKIDKAPFWIVEEYSIDKVIKAFELGRDYFYKDIKSSIILSSLHYPFTILSVNHGNDRRVRINRVYNSINLMLNSCETGVIGEQTYAEEDIRWQCKYRGVGIYKVFFGKLYEILKEENMSFLLKYKQPILSLKKLEENKKGMIYRIRYLEENGYIKNCDAIISGYKKIVTYVRISLNLLEKFIITENLKCIDSFAIYMKKASLLEAIILKEILNRIEESYIENERKISKTL